MKLTDIWPDLRPMLAAPIKKLPIQYPVYVSPKLDGVRGLVPEYNTIRSRTLKPIPNKHVQSSFMQGSRLHGLDGELIVGAPTSKTVYLDSVSGLMTQTGEPDFSFWVFDDIAIGDKPFEYRIQVVQDRVNAINCTHQLPFKLEALEHHLVHDLEELLAIEEMWLDMGFEGCILRHPKGLYKFGRSTEAQGWMLKLKRFMDAEAEIIGFVELMTNLNVATTNALGLTERSSHQCNKEAAGTLGALMVRDLTNGWEFEIGTGFTEAQRQYIWDHRDELLGTYVKYQYFAVGMKDKPRFPSYKGPRNPIDM